MNQHDANENAAHLFSANAPFDPAKWSEWMNKGGHGNFIGMHYRDHGDIWIELGLDWRADLVGDPETGVIASGPIISLLDNTTSLSVWTRTGVLRPQVTLDLRIDYTRTATPERRSLRAPNAIKCDDRWRLSAALRTMATVPIRWRTSLAYSC